MYNTLLPRNRICQYIPLVLFLCILLTITIRVVDFPRESMDNYYETATRSERQMGG